MSPLIWPDLVLREQDLFLILIQKTLRIMKTALVSLV